MSSYLCIKITKAKADICFAQKDVNPFSFFLFCLEEKLKQKKKKLLNRAILSSLGKVKQGDILRLQKNYILHIYNKVVLIGKC